MKQSPDSQLSFKLFEPLPRRGGMRENAGRPRSRAGVSHEIRPLHKARHPFHITLDVQEDLPALRSDGMFAIFVETVRGAQSEQFRIVHFSVQDNHLHMIGEAEDREAISRGLQGFKVSSAKLLNAYLGRSGAVFADRYHYRALQTPTETRNAIRYVLNNHRHHVDQRGAWLPDDWMDRYSSAIWFDGWSSVVELDTHWKRMLAAIPVPVAAPRTWLLSVGWRRLGLIGIDEVPGERRNRRVEWSFAKVF